MKTAGKCREKKLCVASIVIILCDRCSFLKIKLYAFWNQCCTRGRESVAEGVFGGKPNVISVTPPGKQNCPLPDLARGSVVHPAGIEPTTFGVGGRHSIQLRYECMQNGFPFCLYLLPDGVPRGGKKISVVMKQDREALFFFLFLFIVFSFHMFKEL